MADIFTTVMKRLTAPLCLVMFLLAFDVSEHQELKFDQAHTLLVELDRLQKSGKRDKATLEELRDLVRKVPEEVPSLLNDATLELLESPGNHPPDQVHAKIASALQILPPDQYKPEVFVFQLAPKKRFAYLIAYNIPYCASCSRAWIGVVGKKGDRYEILSEVGELFANKSLHVAPLVRSEGGKDRFLVYGTNWGDAHSRLTAVGYVAEEAGLRRFWARTDLPEGSVKVTAAQITLSFLTALTPPWKEKTEVYKVLPAEEIKLERSSERPDP